MSIYEYDEERQRRFDKEEGREKGREEGRQAKLTEVVKEMLRENIPVATIAKYCKESEDVIEALIRKQTVL